MSEELEISNIDNHETDQNDYVSFTLASYFYSPNALVSSRSKAKWLKLVRAEDQASCSPCT